MLPAEQEQFLLCCRILFYLQQEKKNEKKILLSQNNSEFLCYIFYLNIVKKIQNKKSCVSCDDASVNVSAESRL